MNRQGERTRQRQMMEIAGEALDRPGDERAAYLDATCGDDGALRGEVQELLDLMAEVARRTGAGHGSLAFDR